MLHIYANYIFFCLQSAFNIPLNINSVLYCNLKSYGQYNLHLSSRCNSFFISQFLPTKNIFFPTFCIRNLSLEVVASVSSCLLKNKRLHSMRSIWARFGQKEYSLQLGKPFGEKYCPFALLKCTFGTQYYILCITAALS